MTQCSEWKNRLWGLLNLIHIIINSVTLSFWETEIVYSVLPDLFLWAKHKVSVVFNSCNTQVSGAGALANPTDSPESREQMSKTRGQTRDSTDSDCVQNSRTRAGGWMRRRRHAERWTAAVLGHTGLQIHSVMLLQAEGYYMSWRLLIKGLNH